MLAEVEGRVEGHRDGHGFVIVDGGEPSVMLQPAEMRSVLHGDRVRVRVVRLDRRGRPEGRVVDILERKRGPIIGRLLHENSVWVVAPEDRRYGQDILIPRNATGSATSGQVVVVELTEPPSLHSQPVGRVTEVLGEIDDPGMEIEIAVRKYAVPHRFSPATLEQAAALPEKLRAADRRGRVDLRDVPLVTIDGEDARDFDDAVFCEPHDIAGSPRAAKASKAGNVEKGWRLLVAIADVSHYVKPGEPLDVDAYERATSVYFPRRVIPMLPEKLSNGLCSLNPEQERLVMVCDMVIGSAGTIEAYQFYPAVMWSHARLTYNEVAAILQHARGPEAERRAAVVPQLQHLHDVYRALLKQRSVRGAVDFETTETQIVSDEAGRIVRIVPRTRTEAHRLIEEAMLAANVCAADFILGSKKQSLYRVHEGPTPEKRATLAAYLRTLGLSTGVSEEPTPGEMQAIAEATRERPDAAQIHQMLLRSMQQAVYTPHNAGHFGLAYEAYTHFTSPIRRYPDLLVHRVIKAALARRTYVFDPPGPQAVAPPPRRSAKVAAPQQGPKRDPTPWEIAGAHTSACERRADDASRDVEAWLKCRFMRDHLGEEFSGTVTAVAAFGLFVTLETLYVEGLVHITELGGEYYRFDEVRQELRGERSGMRYTTGTKVRVQVSRVDLDARKIDFRLVREGEVARPLPRPRTERVREGSASASDELQAVTVRDRDVKIAARKDRQKAARAAPRAAAKGPRGSAAAKRRKRSAAQRR